MSDAEATQESTQSSSESGEFNGLPPAIDNEAAEHALEKAAPEKTNTPTEKSDNGYQPYVDLSAIQDEATRKAVEGRFAHFSRMMKKNEQRFNNDISQYRDIAAQQSKLIEELQSGVVSVVDHLQSKSLDDSESQWKSALKNAYESGDINAQMEANDKLIEIRTQKALIKQQQKTQKQQPKQETRQAPQYPASATEIGNQGLADGDITQEDYRALEAWQDESDESGMSVRPWAMKGDPRHRQALIESIAVFQNPQYAKMTFEQKLSEIDRRMGTKKASNSQTVMGGGLTGGRKIQKITLSPDIERLAIRQKFGGPKAKSDADHIEAYRKQMELVRNKKGAR